MCTSIEAVCIIRRTAQADYDTGGADSDLVGLSFVEGDSTVAGNRFYAFHCRSILGSTSCIGTGSTFDAFDVGEIYAINQTIANGDAIVGTAGDVACRIDSESTVSCAHGAVYIEISLVSDIECCDVDIASFINGEEAAICNSTIAECYATNRTFRSSDTISLCPRVACTDC